MEGVSYKNSTSGGMIKGGTFFKRERRLRCEAQGEGVRVVALYERRGVHEGLKEGRGAMGNRRGRDISLEMF
jgi:hypothetical protein